MCTGRKSLVRWKPFGPVAARESDEAFDLPPYIISLLQKRLRRILYQPPLWREDAQGSPSRSALRGPP